MRPTPAVRHRAGRPAGRLPAGRARPAGRGGARACRWRRGTPRSTGPPGRCPSRGCATPRSTSRCWSSCATRSRRCSPSRASSSGRGRSSRRSSRADPPRARGSTRGGARPGCTGSAAGASWPSSARCGRPATRWPGGATSPPAGCCPDTAIVDAALASPDLGRRRWRRSPPFNGQRTRRNLPYWWDAVEAAARAARGRAAAAEPARPTRRRRPGPGPTATRRRPPGWPRHARRSRRSPTSTACRWRTCSPPTPCAGCAGSRPPTCRPAGVDAVLAGLGARPWQASSPSPRSRGRSSVCATTRRRADATDATVE